MQKYKHMIPITWRTSKNFGLIFKAIVLLGIAFLIAAGYFYVQSVRDDGLNLQPLALSVSLTPGIIRAPEFETDIDYWNYEIAIDFESKLGMHQMECLIGGETNPDRCSGIPNLIDISWELFEGERFVLDGNSRNPSGMLSETGILYERTIGTFRAQKGHHYALVLHVKRDASELNSANPKILVQIPRSYWEDHAMGVGFGKLLAEILGLIGLAILIGVFVFSRLWRMSIS
jgi:hypothetical protein